MGGRSANGRRTRHRSPACPALSSHAVGRWDGMTARARGHGFLRHKENNSVRLSDKHWREIQKVSGLNDGARDDVASALNRYKIIRQGAAHTPRAAETKRKLQDIAKLAGDILTAVVGDDAGARAAVSGGTDNRRFPFIAIDDGVRWALIRLAQPVGAAADMAKPVQPLALGLPRDLDPTTLDADHSELVGLLRAVERLRAWCEAAGRALPAESRGGSRAALCNVALVTLLDGILSAHTGQHINRSYKNSELQDYVRLCFTAADPKIGPGSIKQAIELFVRKRRAGLTDKKAD
jgi:hypothetical protein